MDKCKIKRLKQKYCFNCQDDFYNNQLNLTGDGCWSLDKAELTLRKRVPVGSDPKQIAPQFYLSCYHQDNFIFYNGDSDGKPFSE